MNNTGTKTEVGRHVLENVTETGSLTANLCLHDGDFANVVGHIAHTQH
jgi:hypothetical protein